MSTLKKTASIAVAVMTMVWAVGGVFPVANAATVDELQAQITALLAQITALQAQLSQTTGTGGTSYTFSQDLTLGSTGADVKALQQFLNAQGYAVAASGAGSVGNESTYFGALTKAALAKYKPLKELLHLSDTSDLRPEPTLPLWAPAQALELVPEPALELELSRPEREFLS